VYVNRGFVSDPTGSDLRDRWVEASIYFGAFHEGKAVGVARLIPHSADFHLWGIFDLHPAWDRAFAGMPLDDVAFEVSALSVPKDAPGDLHSVSAALYRAMFHYLLRNGRLIWFAGVNAMLGRILNRRLGIPMDIIGPAIDYMGGFRMPVMIDLVVFLQRARIENPEEWEYFTDGLELDLREMSEPLVAIPEKVTFRR